MMRPGLLLCYTFIGLIASCTSKTEKAKPVIQSITFIDIDKADSATETNKNFGARRYVHFNLTKDSVSVYRKVFLHSFYGFDRFYKDTVISNPKIDTVLNSFVKWTSTFDFQKYYKEEADITAKAEPCLCDYNYYFIKIKTDSADKVLALSSRLKNNSFDKARELLFSLTEIEKLKPTTKKLNEDSLLGPIISHSGFSTLFLALPLPLDLPPPPPPRK